MPVMNSTASLTIPTTASSGKDDTRIIIACAVSSVAMVCIAAAMFYFRAAVLRREKALTELRRLQALTTTPEKADLRGSSSGKDGSSRPVSTTSSRVLGVRRPRPASVVSPTRHQSYPPDPGRELRRGSLHAIPNGLGTTTITDIEPRANTSTTTTQAKPSERASSFSGAVPQKLGPMTRRASWSFENPVFDQWVPPLMKATGKDDLIDQDDTVDDNIFTLEMEITVDGVGLSDIENVVDENLTTSDGPQRRLRSPRLSALAFGNPLYSPSADQQHSMPTLHEREDSTTSSGSIEKATEKETTGSFICSIAATDEPISMEICRPRSESFC